MAQEKTARTANADDKDLRAWMRDTSDPRFVHHIGEENRRFERAMAPAMGIADRVLAEIAARTPATDETLPYRFGRYFYNFQYLPDREYPRFLRRSEENGEGEVLLNFEDYAVGAEHLDIVTCVNRQSTLLAFAIDRKGDRIYSISVRDLATGRDLPISLPMASGNMTWSRDGRVLFYTELDEGTLRWRRVCRYEPEAGGQSAVTVFDDDDDTFSCYVYRAKSDDFVLIRRTTGLEDEVLFIPASEPLSQPQLIQACRPGVEYEVQHDGDAFVIRTNLDNPAFRLMRAPCGQPSSDHWELLLDPPAGGFLEEFEVFRSALAVRERVEGVLRIRIVRPSDGSEVVIAPPGPLVGLEFQDNYDLDESSLRYERSSFVHVTEVCAADLATGRTRVLKTDRCASGFDPDSYAAIRIEVPRPDGVSVPVTLLSRRDTTPRAVLLHAYGAYGYSIDPYLWLPRFSLLDRGFVLVLAHVRGGGELGRRWHDAGRRRKKPDSIADFVGCAEHLRTHGPGGPLYAMGESAGGLLVGAAINLRPELFDGIVAIAPFVDILNSLDDPTIPLSTVDTAEWGNPADPDDRAVIRSYAPYTNVRRQAYPPVLAIAGLNDTQVAAWEASKWIAEIREQSTAENLYLLKTEMEVGHMGKSGRITQFRDTAIAYAFLVALRDGLLGPGDGGGRGADLGAIGGRQLSPK